MMQKHGNNRNRGNRSTEGNRLNRYWKEERSENRNETMMRGVGGHREQ
jgi:hypothetical protein